MRILERLEVPDTRHLPWTADIALPAVMWVLFAFPFLAGGQSAAEQAISFLSATLFILPLILRRRYPLVMLALITLGGLYTVIALPYPIPAVVAVPIAIYSIARWVPGPLARLSVLVGFVASLLGPVRWTISSTPGDRSHYDATPLLAAICLAAVLTFYVAGRRMRERAMAQKAKQDAVVERYARMLEAREQAARMAESATRTEIARELHDIVAHSLSVMIVQAEGGKALVAKRREKSEEVLATIAETGREALTEMRRIVGVLRADTPAAADYAPTPGLSDLPEMISKAGDRVQYLAPATMPQVPTTLGLTVYRIVQESITNFLKYAGPEATAKVLVRATSRYLLVAIRDDGVGGEASSDGAGSGLKGMQERVSTMGGQLVAGPRISGGFEVVALLPLSPAEQQGRNLGHA